MDTSVPALQPSLAGNTQQYLTFELAGQQYGVEILQVREIKGWEQPTRLPHSPEHVQGVINLRGVVVPVIDLRRRFGLSALEHGRTTVVIVVRVEGAHGELTAGLIVDAVCEVCDIDTGSLQPAPTLGTTIDMHCVRGLAMSGERMLVLLDAAHLVDTALADDAATQAA